MSTTSRCWATSLPHDLVRLIASLLLAGDLLDYVRFRAVCVSWRSATESPRGRGVVDPRFHPRRWMILPEGGGLHPGHPKLHGYVRFFNLDTGAFVRVHIPLFQDHCALDSTDGGLLVLQRDHDTAIRVLHPFTGDIVDLPPLSTLVPQVQELVGRPVRRKLPILRNIFAAATFADDGVVTVVLAISRLYRVAFATSQDRQWTVSWWYGVSQPLLSSQGKIYVACEKTKRRLQIFQIDTPLPAEALQPPKLIATCSLDKICEPVYFVECDSEVLVIGHTDVCRYRMAQNGTKLVVYKLADLIMGMYIPLISIGGKAIFIQERALSVSAKALPSVTGDTIICTHLVDRCLAQYHLGSGTWSLAMDQCSLDGIEPGPCSFIHYIITCCTRAFWNKGLLIRRKKYRAGWPSMASMPSSRVSSSWGVNKQRYWA